MRLHQLVADAARRTPKALAVHAVDGRLTYGELDALADRYSAALAALGVRPGDRVLLWAEKSTQAVALMQGCLRRGAVYVPVTESNPAARAARIARGCGAALTVTDADRARRGAGWESAAGALATFEELLAGAAGVAPPPVDGSPDDLAYILYTSGSTGEPKGVCLSHRNALAFVTWAGELLGLGPRDRLSNHAPFNFDLSVFDLYAAFHAGAAVYLISQEMAYAPEQLVRFLRRHELTVWYSVPSALALMMTKGGLFDDVPPPALRICLFAGEPFPLPLVQQLRTRWPGVRMFNWYGPTETNVCTSYEVTAAVARRTTALPIGTVCSGDSMTLVPQDREGEYELLISGPTVMLGYWGQEPHTDAYPTGDIVRIGADGNLEFTGRRDHLVKVRGQRVELGEVESVLGAHPGVADAAVVVVGSGLEAALHAVITKKDPESSVSLLGLKEWSAQRLPSYMILDALHVVDELPLTGNGKKDRKRMARDIAPEQ
ncbi:amino acid adenylation domain-containing protein [Streptomyces sp. NPDC005393]|uniref:amino acid adenylation domain-containing protein n=1 Tax=Streptomyces sp. NPDC005393 TaxID=3157041 RepID=UPI0033AA2C6D